MFKVGPVISFNDFCVISVVRENQWEVYKASPSADMVPRMRVKNGLFKPMMDTSLALILS